MEAPGGEGRARGDKENANNISSPPHAPQDVKLLRARIAACILRGDDQEAAAYIRQLDRQLNGVGADAWQPIGELLAAIVTRLGEER